MSVSEAARRLESRGLLTRRREDQSEKIIAYVRKLLGRELPEDLICFYRERIEGVGQFTAQTPWWNNYTGWGASDRILTPLLHVDAAPLFDDGCGDLYGLDLTSGVETPGVYFFDHELAYEKPDWAAGSSLGAFLLILAETDRAHAEGWPSGWELQIDPDIENCPRAPALWRAG